MTDLSDRARALGACPDAVKWLDGRTDPVAAWQECPRGDWMIWIIGKSGVSRQEVVLLACSCARLALPHVLKGEDRPRLALEAAEGWARGEVGIGEVRRVVKSAYAAADAADAVDAVAYAVAGRARVATIKRCADIVRERYPEPPPEVMRALGFVGGEE